MTEEWRRRENKLREKLAKNVRRLRTEQGLTLEEAAHRGVLDWRHWQRVEAAQLSVTLRTLIKLSMALDVETAELLQ